MGRPAAVWRARGAAVAAFLLAVLYLLKLREVADVASYLGLLMTAAILVALFTAVRLWEGGWDGRVVVCALCLIGLAVHALKLTVGLPGASALPGGVDAVGVLVAAVQVAILALIGGDVFRRPPEPERQRPYAL